MGSERPFFDGVDRPSPTTDPATPEALTPVDAPTQPFHENQERFAQAVPTTVRESHRDLPFERLGPYQIVRRLGRGGMGEVYQGYDAKLDRMVAIKVMRSDRESSSPSPERFAREAMAAARLDHPHIVMVHGVGEEGDLRYLVMQFIEGESLAVRLMRRQRLRVGETVRIALQILEALGAAHEHGLVHRDVKPANILIRARDNQAFLADFGLAFLREQEQRLTSAHMQVGTPGYMSPEQCQGRDADARSDLYAVGVTLYHALSGQPPFQAENAAALAYQHVHSPPPALGKLAAGISPSLAAVVARLMEKDPARRYPSAAAAADDLRKCLPHTAAAGLASTVVGPLSLEIAARRRWRGAVLLAVACVLVAGLSFVMWGNRSSPNESGNTPAINAGLPIVNLHAASLPVATNSVGMTFVRIPAGKFMMGGESNEARVSATFHLPLQVFRDEYPAHEVQISTPFYLSAYEMTRGEFEQVMGYIPAPLVPAQKWGETPRHPVANVSWIYANEFCERLSELPEERRAGRRYRLPTEAEWEYACRAGSSTMYHYGNDPNQLSEYDWIDRNAGLTTHPVGRLRPNAFGLYDMQGNVLEWCQDRYDPRYYLDSPDESPTGPPVGLNRVLRGGAWNAPPFEARAARRSRAAPLSREHTYGFRVVMIDSPEQ